MNSIQKIASRLPGMVYQFRLQPDGSACFPYVSDAIREVYRIAPQDVREDASSILSLLHPDDCDAFMASIKRSALDLTPWQHEYRVKFFDGEVHWLFGNALPEREVSGSTLWHGFTTDITERKATEKALRLGENRIRATLAAIPDLMIELDLQGRCHDFHSSTTDFLVAPVQDQIGQLVSDVLPVEAAQVVMAAVQEAHEQGFSKGKQYALKLAQGERWFELSIARKATDTGELPRFVVLARDVTERQNAKVQLRISDHALKSISQGVIISGPDGRIQSANAAFLTITGYSEPEIVGRTCDFLQGAQTDVGVIAVMRKAQLQATEFNAEILNYRKDGIAFWNELSITAMFDATGQVSHFIGIMRDITARKSAQEREAAQGRERLLESLRSEAHALLKNVANRVPGMLYQYRLRPDGSSCFPYASDAMRDIFRIDPEDVREDATAMFGTLHPDDIDELIATIQTSAVDLTPWQHEFRVMFADGAIRWLLTNALPDREADGGTLWHGFVSDITERKEMEQALTRQRQQLQDVVDNLPFGLIVVDKYRQIRLNNSNYSSILNLPAGFFYKSNPGFDDLIRFNHARGDYPDQSFEALLQRYVVMLEAGQPISFERTQLDGSWLEIQGRPLRDGGNLLTYSNITERKRKNEQLQQARETAEATKQAFQDLYNQAPCGYHSLDAQGRLIEVNQTLLDLLGYTREEVLGRSLTMFFDAENRAKFDQLYPQFMRNGYIVNVEHDFTRKDGSSLPVLLSAKVILDAQGQFVASRATLIDSSVNKARQQQIKHLNRFLAGVLESVPLGVMVLDKARRVVLKNKRLSRLLDYPPELIERETLAFSDLVRFDCDRGDHPNQTCATVLADCLELMATQETVQLERRRHNGVHLAITGQRIADDWILLTYADITASKMLIQALEDSKQLAEAANLAKSRFLANMSHEIRTPMNGVLGMAQVLLQPNISEAHRLDYARTIFNSGQTLMSLLNDILDLSKIEAGKLELETIFLAPELLMSETTALFAQLTRDNGLHFEAQWRGPERRYLGDPNRLRQMLSNLVGNAIKFTQQGSVRIEARQVACTEQSATLEFAVIDSGIGIAADKLKFLFQTFSQVDSSTTRNYGGSGLGLSIVRTLAQAMGGEAGVQSEVGVGSRFWFRVQVGLPAADAPIVPLQTELNASLPTTQWPQLRGRVLVIEDNLVNQKVMQVMLTQMGLEVALADDGQQALDALMGGERVQLILTDLQMPVMDGYSAAQHIRQWEAQTLQQRLPIIALSADAYASVRERCLAVGMQEMLSKPARQGDLWTTLAKWLPVAPLDAQSAPTRVAHKLLDRDAIFALVNEILPLLAQGKADAIGRFKALQDLVAGSELAPEMAEAGLPLKKFRFDLTHERLRQMASKYEWGTTP